MRPYALLFSMAGTSASKGQRMNYWKRWMDNEKLKAKATSIPALFMLENR